MQRTLRARAPAKLIISGEHAVVYGAAALAVAVNKYTETEVSLNLQNDFIFRLLNLESVTSHTLNALKRLRTRLVNDYYDFLNGNCSITDVLKKPFELLQFSLSNLLEKLNIQLSHGLDIKVNSTIPIGCGMGSSAAAVISTLYAVSKFLGINLDKQKFMLMGIDAENLQHGKSSGLDLHVAAFGGCKTFKQGVAADLIVPAQPMYIINTGMPLASTGECVSFVKTKFNDLGLLAEFNAVTEVITSAWQTGSLAEIMVGIQENYLLLRRIGVVPAKVCEFIEAINIAGGAAKICGAGSIKGNNAGIVLAVGDKEELTDIAQCYGYSLDSIEIDTKGAHVV